MEQAATASIPVDLTSLYEQLKAMLLPDAAQVDYTPRSRAELRAGLEASLLPTYQAAVKERQNNTQKTNASIDADAAARGIGASSWGTDVKNRNYGSEAQDIASMRGTYNSTIASNLGSLLSDQENRKLSADQYNKSSRATAMSNALSMALGNYGKWSTQSDGGAGGPSPAGASAEDKLSSYYGGVSNALRKKLMNPNATGNPHSTTLSYVPKL